MEKYIGQTLYNKSDNKIGKIVEVKEAFGHLCFVVEGDPSSGKYWQIERLGVGREDMIFIREK